MRPNGRVRQSTVPSRIDSAWMRPWLLPMYATLSETTAGNSISVPRPRLQTTRNGGRTWIPSCDCVRARVAPYIGHWSSGRYTRTTTRRRRWKGMRSSRLAYPRAATSTGSGRRRSRRNSAFPCRFA